MRTDLSNVTTDEMQQHVAMLEKQHACASCGADRNKIVKMFGFEQTLVRHIRQNRLVKRDSCIQCVEKHIGKALVLYEELLAATETNNVNVELNHLEIIGNLQAATDEAEQWTELHNRIDTAEREYRYKGNGPDWVSLAEAIAIVKTEQQLNRTN